MELTALARVMAPHVDRLVIALYRRVRERREELAAQRHELGLESFALVVDVRPFILEGAVPLPVVRAFGRFLPEGFVNDTIDAWERAGLVLRRDSRLVPSDRTVRWAEGATALQADVMSRLWAEHSGDVADLSAAADAVIRAGVVDAAQLPLFGSLALLAEPSRGDAYLLHHRLTVLRYLRSDLHVAALEAEGLDLSEAQWVDALWRGERPGPAATVGRLAERGWLDGAGAGLSHDGRRRREGIEAATDRGVTQILARVSPGHLAALEALLPVLPG